MKKFLRDNLSKDYKKSKLHKGAFTLEKDGFAISIRIEESDFLDGEDKWVFVISVDVSDDYRKDLGKNSMLHLFEASVSKMKIEALERWDQIDHWELDDLEGLKSALDSVILPWVGLFDIDSVIEYLRALDDLDTSREDASKLGLFGSLLEIKRQNPPRTRKYFNGALAGLYLRKGDKDNALEALVKHREFTVEDNIGNVEEVLSLVDDEIEKLKTELK